MVTYHFEIKDDLSVEYLSQESKALGDAQADDVPIFADPVIS